LKGRRILAQRARQLAADHATKLPRLVGRGLMALNRGGRIYGPAYARHRALLARTRAHHDPEPALLATVRDAIATVPYYRARYAGIRLDSLAEIERVIGFIDRETVLAHHDELISDGLVQDDYDRCSTGGTSGRPLTFLAPKRRYVFELATMHSLWAEAGFDHHVRAVIRNHRLPDGQPYVIDPLRREIIFDGFRLDDTYFDTIYRIIVQQRIAFIHCYPSTATEFAAFLVRRGRARGPIRAFLSGSENVFAYQRELIEGQLGVRFYNWYGHSEKLVLAGYCRGSNRYHVEPTYGYCELVGADGQIVREPGATGEIVGTSFHNPGMPFLRYRTGDLATYAGDHCDACGRDVLLMENIHGRWSGERIYRPDGSFVTTTALNLHDALNVVIHGLQYVQEARGQLDIHVIKSANFTPAHEVALLDHVRARLGGGTHVHIRYVDVLERAPNGKLTHLISRVRN
jgi:phenylacetate-CoA ligase